MRTHIDAPIVQLTSTRLWGTLRPHYQAWLDYASLRIPMVAGYRVTVYGQNDYRPTSADIVMAPDQATRRRLRLIVNQVYAEFLDTLEECGDEAHTNVH